jgi:hypothetical protein
VLEELSANNPRSFLIVYANAVSTHLEPLFKATLISSFFLPVSAAPQY